MRTTHLVNILNQMTGCRAYYRTVPNGTSLPFMIWYINSTDNFVADNKVHKEFSEVYIDLYTAHKDFVLEKEIEQLLDNNELPWDRSEAVIGEEATLVNTYTLMIPLEK